VLDLHYGTDGRVTGQALTVQHPIQILVDKIMKPGNFSFKKSKFKTKKIK
jgi:hypothetical protein